MERSPNLGALKSGDWQRLQDCAERFEQAWESGEAVDLQQFLPPAGDELRTVVLAELIKSELEIRCRRRQTVRLETYLERFPELVNNPGLLPRLLFEEYRVRQLYADHPPLTTYQQRFPEHYGELQEFAASQSVQAPVKAKYLPFGGGHNLLKRIGSGGFGEVWLAEAPGGIKAAVKILYRPVDHEEAQREIQAIDLIKELRHPFLLQTQAYWASEDRIYIVMELADGSLRDRLKECRQEGACGIPLAELIQYFREAADALDFLHSRHVQHRDIKPENILLLQRHAKVADYGLARSQDSQRMVTASGSGTPFYMAPEVWRGKSSIHSDQYALAATYTELRLDRRVFSSRELAQLMFDHMEATPDLQPLPEAEQAVLRKGLAKEPGDRYASCGAFIQALGQAVAAQLGRTDVDMALPGAKSRPDLGVKGSTQELFGTIRPAATPESRASAADSEGDEATEELGESSGGRRVRTQTGRVLKLLAVGLLITSGIAVGAGMWPWLPSKSRAPPRGCHQAKVGREGEKLTEPGGLPLYERLVRSVGDEQIELVLIRKRQGTDDPSTFYMMENKVWVGLFRQFAEEHPDQVKSRFWDKLAREHKNQRYPVLGVSVEDADRFARWLGGRLPTARLPTVRQWNKAAGLEKTSDPEAGPFRGPWIAGGPTRIAVRLQHPLEVGMAESDISTFGIRDMAGNGREWTRNLSGNLREVPIPNPTKADVVLLRGWGYDSDGPLRFKNMRDGEEDSCEYVLIEKYASDIGFRMVIEIDP